MLRQDNADLRLSDLGREIGLLPERNYQQFVEKRKAIETELHRLRTTFDSGATLEQILRRPEVTYETLPGRISALNPEVALQVEIAVKYEGYIDRQLEEIDRFKKMEEKSIPDGFDYATVPSLRKEARQKLTQIRPSTLGQAARISGVTPADISIVSIWLKRWGQANSSAGTADEGDPRKGSHSAASGPHTNSCDAHAGAEEHMPSENSHGNCCGDL